MAIVLEGTSMNNTVNLISAVLIALSGSLATAQVVSEKGQQTARSAWMKAVTLAQERNAGKVCETGAYQSTILSELGIALSLSSYLKDEVASGKSESAKALRRALAGNLMVSELFGKMSTSQQIDRAMVGTVWYSNNGGAMGALSILQIEKDQVRELMIDPETSNTGSRTA
jgi:hypothetical protein